MLYKLDGGIDHILVDEAQDTAPDQWAIVRALAGEFFSGDGVRAGSERTLDRNLFVVGDEKQSIYSFQGPAGPAGEEFEFTATGPRGGSGSSGWPATSYRSTPQILHS